MRVRWHILLLFSLWELESGIETGNFIDWLVGPLFAMTAVAYILEDTLNTARLGPDERHENLASFRMDGIFLLMFVGLLASYRAYYHFHLTTEAVFWCCSLAMYGVFLTVLPLFAKSEETAPAVPDSSAKKSPRSRLPEHVVRLGLFALCLTIAGIATALLVKDERVRLACFLITMALGMVATKVLPVKALKWVLTSFSLRKIRSDE